MTRLDPTIIRQQISNLILQYPELGEDEILRADMIEGETDAYAFLSSCVRWIGEDDALCRGISEYIKTLIARRTRLERRIEAFRTLAFGVMQAADLSKAQLPEATLSIRNGPLTLVGDADPDTLPDRFVRVEKRINRIAVKDAIQAGEAVDGFAMSNGEPSLSIRIK